MAQYVYLAHFLRNSREQSGLTLMELAGLLEIGDLRVVANWERGYHVPPAHCFPKLIELLEIDKMQMVKAMAADAKASLEKRLQSPQAP